MEESARFTRGGRDLRTLDRLKPDSLRALVIPSFTQDNNNLDKAVVQQVLKVPMLTSVLKECQMKNYIFVCMGASSIHLLARALNISDTLTHVPKNDNAYKFKFLKHEKEAV